MMPLLWQSIPTEHIWRKVWTSSLLIIKNLNVRVSAQTIPTQCAGPCVSNTLQLGVVHLELFCMTANRMQQLTVAAFHTLIINIYRPEMQKYSDVVSLDFSSIPMIKIHFTFLVLKTQFCNAVLCHSWQTQALQGEITLTDFDRLLIYYK